MAEHHQRRRGTTSLGLLVVGLAAAAIATALPALAEAAAPGSGPTTAVSTPLLQKVGPGSLTNRSGTAIQNVSQVETDTFSWGSTVVAAFQDGRTQLGYGAAAIGWATSTDSGRTWTNGVLPGLTTSSPAPNAAYPLVVNQSVAYDAKHHTWLVPSVTYVASGKKFHEQALLVNSSSDGVSWAPATTAVSSNVDKAFGTCDNTPASPGYGTCYVAYSQLDTNYTFAVVRSSDGGVTWSAPSQVPDGNGGMAAGYNAVPVVQPDGDVVVIATDVHNGVTGSALLSFTSADGGATWSVPTVIAIAQVHAVAGIRAFNKPTADVDAAGRVTVVWADCRFRTKCKTNDLVTTSSGNGSAWTAPQAIPLSGAVANRFDPGFAVAPGTSGSSAQHSVVYYTTRACGSTTCLDAMYATSYDNGRTWSTPYRINPDDMPMGWFPTSPKGRMVGDYNSVSFVDGGAVTVLPLATAAPTPFAVTEWALALPPGFQ